MTSGVRLRCPGCRSALPLPAPGSSRWTCPGCRRQGPAALGYLDLLGEDHRDATGDHYSLQWGETLGFLEFLQEHPGAKRVMPSADLGWNALFATIRERAQRQPVRVYDAACGFGGIADALLRDAGGSRLEYVGADIHGALADIPGRIPGLAGPGLLLRWDIGLPLPVATAFDYVLCRASLHHTPDPRRTFASLAGHVAPGGTLAISVYNRKGAAREAVDDALRSVVAAMPEAEAFAACREFAVLGRALQTVAAPVHVPEDLPILGIRAGEHQVQSLIYYHLLKCFWNDLFGERFSTLVNYDWYHPPFAFRYRLDEVLPWFEEEGLEVVETTTIPVQHYLVGRRPAVDAARP